MDRRRPISKRTDTLFPDTRSVRALAAAKGRGEIVRGEADAPLQARQAELGPNARRQPRIGRRQGGPGAFVEAGKDHQVGMLEPRFQQAPDEDARSEEHTSELQSLLRRSYAVLCLKKKNTTRT